MALITSRREVRRRSSFGGRALPLPIRVPLPPSEPAISSADQLRAPQNRCLRPHTCKMCAWTRCACTSSTERLSKRNVGCSKLPSSVPCSTHRTVPTWSGSLGHRPSSLARTCALLHCSLRSDFCRGLLMTQREPAEFRQREIGMTQGACIWLHGLRQDWFERGCEPLQSERVRKGRHFHELSSEVPRHREGP